MQKPLTGRGATHTQEKEPSRQKKESRAFSAVTSGVTTKSFLLLVEGAMRPSLDDALDNLSTCSSRLFYKRPTTKIIE